MDIDVTNELWNDYINSEEYKTRINEINHDIIESLRKLK